MNNITFMKPIVLLKSLDDMTEKQQKQARRFLANTDVITVGETGLKIIPASEAKDLPIFFYGSEAVCMYRQMLGLPDVGIRSIDVNKIVECTCCFEGLVDIVHFLRIVDSRNERIKKLASMNAPTILLLNEYRMLHDRVEYLQDNNWCGHPETWTYRDGEDDTEGEEIPRKSLACIGFDLVTGTCDQGEEEE